MCETNPNQDYSSSWPLVELSGTYTNVAPTVLTGVAAITASFGSVTDTDGKHYLTVSDGVRSCVAYYYIGSTDADPDAGASLVGWPSVAPDGSQQTVNALCS